MAAPRPVPGPIFNGSTAVFQAITQNESVFDPNFNLMDAFRRAIKVFLMSYPELRVQNIPFQLSKFGEYVRAMQDLYEQPELDMTFLPQMCADIRRETYQIRIIAKRISGGPGQLVNARLRARFGDEVQTCPLDDSRDYQIYSPMFFTVTYDGLQELRRNPEMKITFDIEEQLLMQISGFMGQLTTFDFIFANTSPEGFEDWIDFGRDVTILINVEYKVLNELNITPEAISQFHIQSIYRMICRKLTIYGMRDKWTNIGHHMSAFKYDISFQRPYVEPRNKEMFWTPPTTGLNLIPDSKNLIPRRRPSTVKFVEIQSCYETTEDFEEEVCLCSEWCNLNAFFYYNPIYRFLLVRHHQLYMKNVSNVPEMYLCSCILIGLYLPLPKAPVLQLINSGNEYRKKYYDSFGLKSPKKTQFILLYLTSRPAPQVMNALSYNKLRHEMDLYKVCNGLSANPFDEIYNENLIIYYKVLSDLHLFHANNKQYVLNQDIWYKDLDLASRNKFNDYFLKCYERCMTQILGGYDFMFTVDYEYANKYVGSEGGLKEVKKIRDHIFKKSKTDSPFNLMITMNIFLNTFVSISKFLSNVEPRLPQVYRTDGLLEAISRYKQLDTDLDGYSKTNSFNYRMDPDSSGFVNLDQNLHAFYALKLYFYGFELQKQCIDSVLSYVHLLPWDKTQVCPSFSFIWRNMYTMVEQRYQALYPNQYLFDINTDLEQLFKEFYEQFWGKSPHEIKFQPLLNNNINSGLSQYQKLYFWQKNKGNDKRKFAKILFEMGQKLNDTTDRSEWILLNLIMPAIRELSQRNVYDLEVFDQLVYFLVKATLSSFVGITAALLKQMHSLQHHGLTASNRNYLMIKPGWVPLFRTIDNVMDNILLIEAFYMAFEDEFNRISNTCQQTRKMIKGMYQQYYKKLSDEWLQELVVLHTKITAKMAKGSEFLVLHLAYGLSFASAFINHFRNTCIANRKELFRWLQRTPNPNLPHQAQFAECLDTVNKYLKEKDAVLNAIPLQSKAWRTHLAAILPQLNQLTAEQLNLHMNEANN